MNRLLLFLSVSLGVGLLLGVPSAQAEVRTETVLYKHGDTMLEGYLAAPATPESVKRPGVLVVHDWTGLGPYAKMRADQLAAAGYVAFAIDMYGVGVRPVSQEESAKQAGIYRADRALMRGRAKAGLDWLRAQEFVDTDRIAVIGYCFGGGVALELARSGAPLSGVVTFHGSLDTPSPADAANIKARILVLHGADDPYVPPEQVAGFIKEMRDAGVDWQLVQYGGAVHGFSDAKAGNDTKSGFAYDARADRRSWAAMRAFFDEIFE